ncbi:PilZ domain-containing protein [uncultured Desulfosarcina sp.]|uniref:PilZ domain-containing protein n=1 Tax=uncultured Desulfosarcina sp. TaxID=218289 RepID=UPI0029C92E08|nr:PilZ domain-containing protein [uncultured Desulfosarcina sp.]
MQEPSWQVEKKKILTRLSIAIYKMTDEQLISLLHLFEDLDLKQNEKLLEIPKPKPDEIISARDRQLLIARFFLLINQLQEADLLRFMSRYERKRFAMLREFPRVPCNISLDLAANGRAINCFATDISAGGMFVESCESFTMGQPVSICFSIGQDQLPLKLKASVVRLEHGGIGVKYESLTQYQVEILKDLINRFHRQVSTQFKVD